MQRVSSLSKRLMAIVYESFLLIALWFICTWGFVMLFGDASLAPKRYALQVFLWCVTGTYFVWHWQKTGQTLAMKTWKMQLTTHEGTLLNNRDAVMRYILASVGTICFGIGFLWALIDKEHQFLHDRLMNSRITDVLPR